MQHAYFWVAANGPSAPESPPLSVHGAAPGTAIPDRIQIASMVCCSKMNSAAFALERLEPALRIDQTAGHKILLTILLKMIPRIRGKGDFVHGDQTAVHRREPIATSYVLQRINEFSGFFDRRGKVCVREKRDGVPALPACRWRTL